MTAKAKKVVKKVTKTTSAIKRNPMKTAKKLTPLKQKLKKGTEQKPINKKTVAEKSLPTSATHPFKKIPNTLLPYHPKKGEGYMSSRMKAHFRKVLLDWKNTLTQEMAETVNSIKETPTQFADLSDRATQEEQFNLELRERDRDRKLIKKIDDTIRRIDEDTYGYCDACGEEIGLRRLEARPTAVLCVDCKTLDEIREKQEGI